MPRTKRKVRLDVLLCERGLFPSRSRAAAAVMAGEVLVGRERARAEKPGQQVAVDTPVDVVARRRFVSRGGEKLEHALAASATEVAGCRALDVGSATGGFTDCLLQRGAAHVVAVDVGRGLLDQRLRRDPRVTLLERTNARELAPGLLPYRPDLVAVDVSFISLRKVLPAVIACTADRFDCFALVKPQFELGPGEAPGGVVRERAARLRALAAVARFARDELGLAVLGFYPSGLPGPSGNRETFVHLAEGGRHAALDDGASERAAAAAEDLWEALLVEVRRR
ncbi:MAG: TlyA family RNA methyltransferase [Thermoleophilum sp.]|nr:TlyA family RNA methyltransferase [Thermoleophilum sp.]